jgi:FecR-like protein
MKLRTLKLAVASIPFLFLALLGQAAGQEAKVLAGKVIDIDGPRLYTNRLSDKSWFQGYMGMSTFLNEKLRTDDKTQAVVQFYIGGRAGIGRNSKVEIVSLESLETVKGGALKIDSGTFWAKFDKQDKEFQIQTAGGVIGIEGTELLIGVEEETGITEVLLFEGQVRVTDNDGKEELLLPGDYAAFGGPSGMCVLSYPAPSLRSLVVERFPKFSSFLASQNITSIPKPASPTLVRGHYKKRDDLLTVLASAQEMETLGVSGLQVSSASGPPAFSWSGSSGASSYAVFVTGDEGMEDILFSSTVDSTDFTVPDGAQGLDPGAYFWTVVPLDANGEPVGQPSQDTFQTPGWTSAGVAIEEDS